jgi:hypothetical protein
MSTEDELLAALTGGQTLEGMIGGIERLSGIQSESKIPGSSAQIVTKGAGIQAALLKQLLADQAARKAAKLDTLNKMRAERQAQQYRTATASQGADIAAKARQDVLQGRLALKAADVQLQNQRDVAIAQAKIAERKALKAEADDLAYRAMGERGPGTALADATIKELEGPRFNGPNGVGGSVLAADLKAVLDQNLNSAVTETIAKEQTKWEQLGVGHKFKAQLASSVGEGGVSGGGLVDELKRRYQSGESIQGLLDERRVSAVREVQTGRLAENVTRRLESKGVPEAETWARNLVSAAPVERPGIVRSMRKATGSAAKSKTVRAGIGGAIGTGIIAYALNKIMGGDTGADTKELPPEIKMALMQRLAGGGGAERPAPDEAVTTGRELGNVQKTLSILKMMQDMAGMQTPAGAGAGMLI